MPEYSECDIKKIRSLYSLNQKQFVAVMNISDSTVQKRERGAKKPAGSSRKLFYILEKNGISALLNRSLGKRNRRGSVFLRRFRFDAGSVADGFLFFRRAYAFCNSGPP